MPTVGDQVGRYLIEGILGEGGMGRVYRARDTVLGRRVALKVMLAEGVSERVRAEAAARMMREARAVAAFSHANVVAIHDIGEVEGNPYIAMELVAGATLRAYVGDKAVSNAQKLGWLVDVARGLGAAHRAGLVHRDIKPENVMITSDGAAKILDFGIARRSEDSAAIDGGAPTAAANLASLTAEGIVIGTPQYMPPEQLQGHPLDGRADQFAWAVMAWELFVGELPWGASKHGAQLVAAVLAAPVKPLSEVATDADPRTSDAIARALSKDPKDRYASMDELLAALTGKEPREGAVAAPSVANAAGLVDTSAPTAPALSQKTVDPATAPKARQSSPVVLALLLLVLGGVAFGARALVKGPRPTAGDPKAGSVRDAAPALDAKGTSDELLKKGVTLRSQGNMNGAIAALSECVASPPSNVECVRERMRTYEAMGRCFQEQVDAWRGMQISPKDGDFVRKFATVSYGLGESSGKVRQLLGRARSLSPDERSAERRDALASALVRGDFDVATDVAARLAAWSDSDRWSVVRFEIAEESGLLGKLKSDLEAARRQSAAADAGDSEAAAALTGFAQKAGLTVSPHEAAEREAWLLRPRTQDGARGEENWITSWVANGGIVDATEAATVLGALSDAGIAGARAGASRQDLALLGSAYATLGRWYEALAPLTAATTVCDPFESPIGDVHALSLLGQAYDQSGDLVHARVAYQRIIVAWATSKPRSITVERAWTRLAAIGLPHAPPTKDALKKAKKFYENGLELESEQRYPEALASFLEAKNLSPRMSIQNEIARTYRLMKDMGGAYVAYRDLLADYTEAMSPVELADSRDAADTLLTLITPLAIEAPDGASVAVDDKDIGVSPIDHAVWVNTGAHHVLVTQGTWQRTVTVDAKGGGDLQIVGVARQ
jgi:tRNA A-37 threonylcarbamoyl transferase component Bud32/tetratricopeptide (TPR) repeat protein